MIYISVVVQLCTLVCTVTAPGARDRSVNLNLETVMTFDRKNLDADVRIIDNVQQFLSKVRNVLDRSKKAPAIAKRSFGNNAIDGDIKFTGFLEHVIRNILTYNDEDLEKIAAIIDDEIRKYHYKGCKFYELFENNDKLRYYVTDLLEQMRQLEGKKLRNLLERFAKKLRDNDFTLKEIIVMAYINSLYNNESQDHMKKILIELDDFKKPSRRTHTNLVKTVRKGLRSIIFDHYSKLSPDTRRDIKMKIASYVVEYVPEGKSKGKIITYGTVTLIDYVTTKPTRKRKKHEFLRHLGDKTALETKDPSSYPARDLEAEKNKMPHRFISLYPEEIPTSTEKHKIKKGLRSDFNHEEKSESLEKKFEHEKTTKKNSKDVERSLEIEDKPEIKPKKIKSSSEQGITPKLESSAEHNNKAETKSKEVGRSSEHEEEMKEKFKEKENSSEKVKSSQERRSKTKSIEVESSIEHEIKPNNKSANSSLEVESKHELKTDKVESSEEHEERLNVELSQKHASSWEHETKHKIKSTKFKSSLEHETKYKIKSKKVESPLKHKMKHKIKSKKVERSLEHETKHKIKSKKVRSSLEHETKYKIKSKKVKKSSEHKTKPKIKSKDSLERVKVPNVKSKKRFDTVHPKTVMVVREGRPLRELLTEHNSIIQEMSSRSPHNFQKRISKGNTWKKRSRGESFKKRRDDFPREKPNDIVETTTRKETQITIGGNEISRSNDSQEKTLKTRSHDQQVKNKSFSLEEHLRYEWKSEKESTEKDALKQSKRKFLVNPKEKRSKARALKRQNASTRSKHVSKGRPKYRKSRHRLHSLKTNLASDDAMLSKIDRLDKKLEVVISKLDERTVTQTDTKNYYSENTRHQLPRKWKNSRRTTNESILPLPKDNVENINATFKNALSPANVKINDIIQTVESNENKIFIPTSNTFNRTQDSAVGLDGLNNNDNIEHSRKEGFLLGDIEEGIYNNKSSKVGQRPQVGSFGPKISYVENKRNRKTINNSIITDNTVKPNQEATKLKTTFSDKYASKKKDNLELNLNKDKNMSYTLKPKKTIISSKYPELIMKDRYLNASKDDSDISQSTNDTIQKAISVKKERYFRASDNEDDRSKNKTRNIDKQATNATTKKANSDQIRISTKKERYFRASDDENENEKTVTKIRLYDDENLSTTNKVLNASFEKVNFRASEDDQNEDEKPVNSILENEKSTPIIEKASSSEFRPTTAVVNTAINATQTNIINSSLLEDFTHNNTKINATEGKKREPSTIQTTVTINTSNSTASISTTASTKPVSGLSPSLSTTAAKTSSNAMQADKQRNEMVQPNTTRNFRRAQRTF